MSRERAGERIASAVANIKDHPTVLRGHFNGSAVQHTHETPFVSPFYRSKVVECWPCGQHSLSRHWVGHGCSEAFCRRGDGEDRGASLINSSPSYMLSTTTAVRGSWRSSRCVASIPEIPGMWTSISTTSGPKPMTRSRASSASRIDRRPIRKSSWSSTTSTRMLTTFRIALRASRVWSSPTGRRRLTSKPCGRRASPWTQARRATCSRTPRSRRSSPRSRRPQSTLPPPSAFAASATSNPSADRATGVGQPASATHAIARPERRAAVTGVSPSELIVQKGEQSPCQHAERRATSPTHAPRAQDWP
jgi:hypothetical protein